MVKPQAIPVVALITIMFITGLLIVLAQPNISYIIERIEPYQYQNPPQEWQREGAIIKLRLNTSGYSKIRMLAIIPAALKDWQINGVLAFPNPGDRNYSQSSFADAAEYRSIDGLNIPEEVKGTSEARRIQGLNYKYYYIYDPPQGECYIEIMMIKNSNTTKVNLDVLRQVRISFSKV